MFDWFRYRPYETGYLPEKDGYRTFYQLVGNPRGMPVLVFNGGPGFPNDPRRAGYLNPAKQRIIALDQRGTGRSIAENGDLLHNNTTDDLLEDAKRLIEHLEIAEKVISAGCSWGATLALLFAEKYPEAVDKIIAISTFTASRKYAANWFENGARLFYPDIIDELREKAGCDNFTAYAKELLFSDDEEKIREAQLFYGSYEAMLGKKSPKFDLNRDIEEWELPHLKIFLHYETNDYFLQPHQIINNIGRIKDIPLLLLHNRLDLCCPVEQAWDIHRAHPRSTIHIVPELGHGTKVMGKLPKKLVQEFLKDF